MYLYDIHTAITYDWTSKIKASKMNEKGAKRPVRVIQSFDQTFQYRVYEIHSFYQMGNQNGIIYTQKRNKEMSIHCF